MMKMMMLRTGCISYSSLGDGKGSFVGRKTGTLFTQVSAVLRGTVKTKI